MDETGRELSRASLRLFSKELSPEYERVRKMLLGHLAAQGASNDQLVEKDANDRKNVEILSNFAKFLPTANYYDKPGKSTGWYFSTKDPFAIKNIQSFAVWSRQDWQNTLITTYRPYLVLGKSGQRGNTALLLANLGETSKRSEEQYGDIYMRYVGRTARKLTQGLNSNASTDYPTPDDARSMFSPSSRTFMVGGRSPGSVTGYLNTGYYNPKGITHLSDQNLAQFDVHNHIHRIATAFGIEATLDLLLSQELDI